MSEPDGPKSILRERAEEPEKQDRRASQQHGKAVIESESELRKSRIAERVMGSEKHSARASHTQRKAQSQSESSAGEKHKK